MGSLQNSEKTRTLGYSELCKPPLDVSTTGGGRSLPESELLVMIRKPGGSSAKAPGAT